MRNPKIILQKEVNLDLTPKNEFLFVIRNGDEEILVVTDLTKKNLLFKKVFTLLNIGAIDYDPVQSKWIPNTLKRNTDELYIIKNISFQKIGTDSFESLFLEILSEEPPLELFSVPLVFRNYKLVFDGFELFKETDLLKKLNRVPMTYLPEKKGIRVLSANPSFDKLYSLE